MLCVDPKGMSRPLESCPFELYSSLRPYWRDAEGAGRINGAGGVIFCALVDEKAAGPSRRILCAAVSSWLYPLRFMAS